MSKYRWLHLFLFEFSKNLALHFVRPPSNHGYRYALSGDHTNCLTRFFLRSEPFMKQSG